MSYDNRQEVLARWKTGGAAPFVAAPGSGATITIWDSGNNDPSGSKGFRWKRLIMRYTSSADSGTNGVSFETSDDNGTNWRTLVQYSDTAAGAPNIHYVAVQAPRIRLRYTNSANVLTTWDGSLVADEYERATQ